MRIFILQQEISGSFHVRVAKDKTGIFALVTQYLSQYMDEPICCDEEFFDTLEKLWKEETLDELLDHWNFNSDTGIFIHYDEVELKPNVKPAQMPRGKQCMDFR